MYDLHCHILPGLDDGAQTVEDSLALAQVAIEEGITHIVATPHHNDGFYVNDHVSVRERVEHFNQVLFQQHFPLTVLPGQEVRYYDRLVDELEQKQGVMTLNDSRYLLLEFPHDSVPRRIEETIHELQVIGLVPIIAHPERNKEIASDHEKLVSLVKMGALAQVTAQSIAGGFGSKLQAAATELCRRNLVHVIASDAHNVRSRPFAMKEAFQVIRHKLGEEYETYYKENARKVVNNESVDYIEPVRKKVNRLMFWKK